MPMTFYSKGRNDHQASVATSHAIWIHFSVEFIPLQLLLPPDCKIASSLVLSKLDVSGLHRMRASLFLALEPHFAYL